MKSTIKSNEKASYQSQKGYSPAAVIIDECSPDPEKTVEYASDSVRATVDLLEQALHVLSKRLSELEGALAPILSPAALCDEKLKEEAYAAPCYLTARVNALLHCTTAATSQVQNLLDRIVI